MTPWEHHPALTSERLCAIGELIRRGRNSALDRFDPAVGCSPWSLGCEAFEFQRHEISQAAEVLPWLQVLNPTMQFVFSVDGVPVRFYKGAPDEPTTRTLKQTFVELQQQTLFGPEELVPLTAEPLYRFAVETDDEGAVLAISFVVLAGELPVLVWQVPLEDAVARMSPMWTAPAEGVDLPPPVVSISATKDADKKEAGG